MQLEVVTGACHLNQKIIYRLKCTNKNVIKANSEKPKTEI